MSNVVICLDDETRKFYEAVADRADRTLEQVLADALFRLAGELALEALAKKKANQAEVG